MLCLCMEGTLERFGQTTRTFLYDGGDEGESMAHVGSLTCRWAHGLCWSQAKCIAWSPDGLYIYIYRVGFFPVFYKSSSTLWGLHLTVVCT
jgi:hypothetical protein